MAKEIKSIGILGSGNVAQTLGTGFLSKGYNVKLGTRETGKLSDWIASAGDKASTGSLSETAAFGDVVFICVHGLAALDAIRQAGLENFSGKTVVDVTNPLDFSGGMPPKLASTLGNSLGEQIQAAIPGARIVKAFNTINASTMVNPMFGDQSATLLIAGNDDDAKKQVTALAEEFGWEVEDFGPIDQAYFLESLASMWVNYAFRNNSWTHAFKLLKH